MEQVRVNSMLSGYTSKLVESQSASRLVKGFHLFTLENYSLCKDVGYGNSVCSNPFVVGGCQWVIAVCPGGTSTGTAEVPDEEDIYGEDFCVGIRVSLLSGCDKVYCLYKLTLLDQSGEGNHRSVSSLDDEIYRDLSAITVGRSRGAARFIGCNFLEKSPYLKDDCLKIECEIDVLSPLETEILTPTPSNEVLQCNEEGIDFLDMLETGEGSDVIFSVGGRKFRAHEVVLSARSPVFESMFASHLASHEQQIVITGMEPRVFEALLHFIYSDTLPEYEESLYAFGPSLSSTFPAKLLAAADLYDLSRLKSICESMLWASISLIRFVETLMLAERCNASQLKYLCFGFAVDLYADLVELNAFNCLGEKCPQLLSELVDYLSSKGVQHVNHTDKELSAC